MTHHHHHHHSAFYGHHHRHRFHHLNSSQMDVADATPANRVRFLGISILTSLLITLAAIAFMTVALVMFFTNAYFPRFLIIPFVAVPTLMIVIAVVSLVRSIRLYKAIQENGVAVSSEEEPVSSDDKPE